MTSIRLTKNIINQLKENNTGSLDTILNQLIDNVENDLEIVEIDNSPFTTARVNQDTIDRLDAYRLTKGESYENIIIRMILLSKTINTITE